LGNVIVTLHSYNAYLIMAAGAITGIWGLLLYFTRKEMKELNRAWRVALLITIGLGLLQALFGITMVALGLKPGGGKELYYLHYVYGGIVALAIPIAYVSYTTGGKNLRRDLLIYSIAALILAAAAVRAWMTGPLK
jgi:heme A synthase